METWEAIGLAGIVGNSLYQAFKPSREDENKTLDYCSSQGETGAVDPDRIEYLEKRIELLEAKLAGKKAKTEEYVNPDYPPGGIRCKFRPEDISHDGIYVRKGDRWVPWTSYYD